VWQLEEGLPQNTIRAIHQTRDGYLWLATEEGLARFDGVRFTVFDSSNTPAMGVSLVNALFEDHEGTLWVGTDGGGLLALRDGRFSAYGPRDKTSLLITGIASGSDGLWLGSKGIGVPGIAVLRLRDGTVAPPAERERFPLTTVSAVHADRRGTLWIGSAKEGLLSVRDGQSRLYTVQDGLPDNRVLSLAEGSDGALWIGTEIGVSRLARDGTFTSHVLNHSIRAVLEDRDGSLWVGSNEAGLWRLREGELLHFGKAEGLSSDSVWSFHEDREGSLWIGTNGGGLNRFRDGAVTTIGVEEGLSGDQARCVYQDRAGSVWVGTKGGGVSRLQDGRISALTTKAGLSKDTIVSLSGDNEGALWLGTNGAGLNRLEQGKVRVYTSKDGLPGDSVFALLGRRDGSLWIGTRGAGLSRLQDVKFFNYGADEGLRDPYVWTLVEDGGRTLWIGTAGGLYSHAEGRIQQVIPEIPAHCIHIDAQGVLWIGTAKKGLYRWKAGKAVAFSTREGLIDDTIEGILEDEDGNLWMGSNKGIFSVSKGQLDAVAEGRSPRVEATGYGTADGMKSRECSYGSSWKTRDGKLWFPTIRGVACVDPRNLKRNRLPPPVVIEEVVANGRLRPAPAGTLEVPPGEGKLQFRYTALSLVAPRKVQFAHRLEGLDQAWTDPGTAREAAYANLRPGNYTFRVMACDNDGLWNEAGAAVKVHLQPYFYQTGWFYSLWLAALALAGWQVHRFRVRRVIELERVRTRIAADLHDDIGSGLSQIAILSEVVRQQSGGDGAPAAESLTKIASTAGELVDSMSDIVWAVNPTKDHLKDLVHRMRRFASDVLTARNVNLAFRADGLDSARRVAPDFRRHVYLIFKESVNNAARHSGCSRVEVLLDFSQQGLSLQVRDDGRGLDVAAAFDGHGLDTMRQRALALGGRLEIVSQPGEGTTVTVQVPMGRRGMDGYLRR
jgi:ligand-binding sensor domain-containing protein/signal transduction histidine kinase